jgi:hypothetical protein
VASAARYLREHRKTEIALIDLAEIRRYNPAACEPVNLALCPPPGSGVLDAHHKLYWFLKMPPRARIEYAWVPEQDCCILTWPTDSVAGNPGGAFARALVYAVLRVRRAA